MIRALLAALVLSIVVAVPASADGPRWGTLMMDRPEDRIDAARVLLYANSIGHRGTAAAGAPSPAVRDAWFSQMPGWTRYFIRGTYAQLLNLGARANQVGMADLYECFGYGPESSHQAGPEALAPLTWVPRAEALAHSYGKCLIYGPAVRDYEERLTDGSREQMAALIAQVAPHVDVWVVQLAKYQGLADMGLPRYTMADFTDWIGWWAATVKSANPEAQVWVQLGTGKDNPFSVGCTPPAGVPYLLAYRDLLGGVGIDAIHAMPSQLCQMSTDPVQHEWYLQHLEAIRDAIEASG